MNKRPNNASMLVLQVYDISISMNKHVCNFVLREGKKGEKKKQRTKEHVISGWRVYIFYERVENCGSTKFHER